MNLLEPKELSTIKNQEIKPEGFSSDYYRTLANLKNSLAKNEALGIHEILEYLPNIFPEIDRAVVLEQGDDAKYVFIDALAYDISDLKAKSFALKELFPKAEDLSSSNQIYQSKNKKNKSKLFSYLDKKTTTKIKSRVVFSMQYAKQNLFLIAEAIHLDFEQNQIGQVADFSKQMSLVLEHNDLRREATKKLEAFKLLTEIQDLCDDKVSFNNALIHTTKRLVAIFDLKANVYLREENELSLSYNIGFEALPQKLSLENEDSTEAVIQTCIEKCNDLGENRAIRFTVAISEQSKLRALLNIASINGSHIPKSEQELIKSTIKQIKVIIEHSLFYKKMIRLEHRNLLISENMQGVVFLCDASGHVEYVSPSIRKHAGYIPDELLHNAIYNMIHSEDIDLVKEAFAKAETTKPYRIIHRFYLASGEFVWVESAFKRVIQDKQEYFLVTSHTNEGTREAEEQLEYRDRDVRDSLTGLPNRAQLLKALGHAISNKKSTPKKIFALILININRFKNINDNLGHKVGDELLRRVAKRLNACVYSSDLVARIGGDEFAIVLDDLPNNADAKAAVERVNQEFSRAFFIDENEIHVSLSMGLAFINNLKLNSTEILRNADIALRNAKKTEDGYKVFNNSMLNSYKTRSNLEKDLQIALQEEQLFLLYQPMFDLMRRKVSGFEALIRWNHPKQGLISPADFIPIAEESGLIVDVDYWVLENAAKQLKSWNLRYASTKDLFVSINLSARNIVIDTSANEISECIRKQGIEPKNIKLEVTEGVMMNNMRVASRVLSELRSEGFRIQLDDFGTGYSSLSYIQKLPIDSLKIDQSFIRRMDGGKQDEAIVQAVLALGAGLNLEVVAEGVETTHQLERLTEMNCDYAQGYLIARPLAPQEVEKRFFYRK